MFRPCNSGLPLIEKEHTLPVPGAQHHQPYYLSNPRHFLFSSNPYDLIFHLDEWNKLLGFL
jgi:hypothetical protein